MKIEGPLHEKTRQWSVISTVCFIIAYIVLTMATIMHMKHMVARVDGKGHLYWIGIVAMLCIAMIPHLLRKKDDGWAFLSSCFSITLLFVLFGLGIYPELIRSSISPEINSITIFNSASSELTLKVLLIIAGIGVPLVLAYGFWIYRIFRGKVKLDHSSY